VLGQASESFTGLLSAERRNLKNGRCWLCPIGSALAKCAKLLTQLDAAREQAVAWRVQQRVPPRDWAASLTPGWMAGL